MLVPLDEAKLRRDLAELGRKGIEALTVSLFNAYVDGKHERRIAEIAAEVMPRHSGLDFQRRDPRDVRIRTHRDDVVNSYIRPVVSKYVQNSSASCRAR